MKREHWEYQDLTGNWKEPDESATPVEAGKMARVLGTAYRRVIVQILREVESQPCK